jgi:peptide/nickel transport system substrate-binding protein
LIAAACTGGNDDNPDNSGSNGDTRSTVKFVYDTVMFEDLKYDNVWAYYADPTVWNAYVLVPTRCSMYSVEAPNFATVPNVAKENWKPATKQGDVWVTEVKLNSGLTWSDGKPLTAKDVAFTFNTVKDLALGGNWVDAWKPVDEKSETAGVLKIEAVDDTTVRITFNDQPGLAIFPSSVGGAPLMAEHAWAAKVDAAKKTKDPAKALTSESGVGDPACGPVIFDKWEKGAFANTKPNPKWHLVDTEYTHYDDGSIRAVNKKLGIDGVFGGEGKGKEITKYTLGPYIKEQNYAIYGEQSTAVLALRKGEASYLYNGLGMQRGLQDQVLADNKLEAISNPTNGMRYLAFNFRRQPMNDIAFRQALATMIDREFMTKNVLGGIPQALFTATPPGNERWFDKAKADEISKPYREAGDPFQRVEKAVKILKDAGYTWTTEPKVSKVDGVPEEIVPGAGIKAPGGKAIPQIELAYPSEAYDPFRATYGLKITTLLEQLGFNVKGRATGFNVLSTKVDSHDFDMYILGWSLGDPAAPDHYEAFWTTKGSSNELGYSNKEYDASVAKYMRAQTEAEAKEILWNEIEPSLSENLPYIILFDSPVLEFYRSASVEYPFTESLGGIQYQQGMTDTVTSAK